MSVIESYNVNVVLMDSCKVAQLESIPTGQLKTVCIEGCWYVGVM